MPLGALLIAVGLSAPCVFYDTHNLGDPRIDSKAPASSPISEGIHGFQVQNEPWRGWCHAPMGIRWVTLNIEVWPESPGQATFWRPFRRTRDGGWRGTKRPYDPDWSRAPTIVWLFEPVRTQATIRLGLDWLPPDLFVWVQGEPVHMKIEIVGWAP